PAFFAPELLRGSEPSTASDVYALGLTLFAALTGHSPYERRSGEPAVAQLLRVANEQPPDLREHGVPETVAAVVDRAMARDPADRPSALELGEQMQQAQSRLGLPVAEMALQDSQEGDRSPRRPVAAAPGS